MHWQHKIMDKNKQPGIFFDEIILKEVIFSRKEGYSDKPDLSVYLSSNASFSENCDELIYEMTCEIKDEKDFFNIKCTMIGFFSVLKGQENMGLREYSKFNAPAAVYPYIREMISSITTRAGISPVVIPPTNLNILKRDPDQEPTQ